jgi:hypothetical protein
MSYVDYNPLRPQGYSVRFPPEDVDPGKPYQPKINSDGGPTDYYDFPSEWTTFNDFIEYKSQTQWLSFSFHLGNIGKALCRWGDKNGTTEEYDAKKIIYSGVRILKMLIGAKATRDYLQRLLDDPQFKD